MEKKAQFKIQQMAFMLIGVIIFFVLIGLFWLMLQSNMLKQTATQLGKDEAITLSGFVSGSSEFSCSQAMGSYCVDTDKIMMLKDLEAYSRFWPVSSISVRKLDGKPEKECNISTYPDCNFIKVYENSALKTSGEIGSFISLCRHDKTDSYATEICDIGKINIGYDVK